MIATAGEAARLVAWLEERDLAVRSYPAVGADGEPLLVVRAVVPGLREAGLALLLAAVIPVLRTWRDVRSEGRAEEAASLLAPAVASEVTAGGVVDHRRVRHSCCVRWCRGMSARCVSATAAVTWLWAGSWWMPAAVRRPRSCSCVEMGSLPGDDVYAAAWAVGE